MQNIPNFSFQRGSFICWSVTFVSETILGAFYELAGVQISLFY